jgi:hypothetical protein
MFVLRQPIALVNEEFFGIGQHVTGANDRF